MMPETIPVSLQMYTVRDDASRDFAATVEAIAKIGYIGVELAGYGSAHTAAAAKQILDDNGLIVSGAHIALDTLEAGVEGVIEECEILGNEFVIVPYLSPDRRSSIANYQQLALIMNEIGEKLRSADLQLAYHNHDFEFEKFGGDVTAYDAFFAAADPDLVKVEMDTFWVKKAGEDPAAYIKKYSGRVPLIHLKDMTPEGTFAEVGEGTIDYAPIFAASEAAGTLFYIVEQDQCFKHAPMESIRISFENLKKLGVAS